MFAKMDADNKFGVEVRFFPNETYRERIRRWVRKLLFCMQCNNSKFKNLWKRN